MRKLTIIEHISLDGVIQHSADDNDFSYTVGNSTKAMPSGIILSNYKVAGPLKTG